MGRWSCLFLLGALALSGCGDDYPVVSYTSYQSAPAHQMTLGGHPSSDTAVRSSIRRVAILLPMTGARADLGQVLLQAAQLALGDDGALFLDVLDTGGTAAGAIGAARMAIAHGDGLFIGPLTSSETAAIAPIATAGGIPVLAFTNDASQAQPGVWPMGISPAQQVRRLVAANALQGRTRLAALLPDSDFGRVMADALQAAAQEASVAEPAIHMHAPGMSAITAAVREVANYGERRGPIDARVRALKADPTPDARREILQLQKSPVPPPPFDVLLLADTGDELQEIAAVLPYYDIDRSAVQVIGPALWADRSSGSGIMQGAWYAAPDTAARGSFAASYTARYGTMAPAIADLAFDAALIARFVASSGQSLEGALTQRTGFLGSDGLIAFMPDGHVRRGLAVFKIDRSGASMVEPPQDTAASAGF